MDQETLVEKIDRLSADLSLLGRAVHGTETETVILGGVATPSYRKLVADINARESAAAQDAITAGMGTVQEIADTAAQHVADATHLAVEAATEQAERAKGFADAAGAMLPDGLAERVTATETKNSQQDTRLDAVEAKNTQQDTAITSNSTALTGKLNTDFSNVDLNKANIVLQRVVYEASTMTSTTSVIPCDDTIPQITEGSGYMAVYITPKRANSKVEIDVTIYVTCYNATSHLVAAVFKDSEPNAIAAAIVTNGGVGFFVPLRIKKIIQLGDTNQHTIQVRVGVPNNSYPISINGTSSRMLGGALTSSLILTEYAA